MHKYHWSPKYSSLLLSGTAYAQGKLKSERIILLGLNPCLCKCQFGGGTGPHFGINGPSAASTNLHMQDVVKSCIPASILTINRSIFLGYCYFLDTLARRCIMYLRQGIGPLSSIYYALTQSVCPLLYLGNDSTCKMCHLARISCRVILSMNHDSK